MPPAESQDARETGRLTIPSYPWDDDASRRDRHTAVLTGALAAARAGRPAVVTVHGQPGSGKSELLRTATDAAVGMRVLRAVGHVAESDLPYAGLHQLIGPLRPRVGEIPPVQRDALLQVLGERIGRPPDRMTVASALLTLVTALTEDSPAVIAVDDFGWIDPSTQKLLVFMCRRLDADAVAVVLCARDDDAELIRGLGVSVETNLLDAGESRALARQEWPDLGAFVTDRVVDHAAGLPLALVEMPAELTATQRAGREPLPSIMPTGGQLRSLYASRLDGLSGATRDALLLASFHRLGPDELAAALYHHGRDLADLAPAERVRLIRVRDGVCEFTHPSVRSLVQSAAPASDLAAAHSILAAVFRDDPTRYAAHLHGSALAADTEVALALEVAARQSERQGAHNEAAYHWELAARRHPDPSAAAPCRAAAVEAYLRVGIGPQALVLLDRLRADAANDAERARWRATEVAIRGWTDASSPPDAGDVVALGRRLVASPETVGRVAGTNLIVALAGAQLAWGDYRAAADLVAVVRGGAPDSLPIEPRLLCDLVDVLRGTGRGATLRGSWLAEIDDARLTDPAMFIGYVAIVLGWLDESSASQRVADRLRTLVVERGGYATAALPLGLITALDLQNTGDWDRASLEYAAAEQLASDCDFAAPYALIVLRHAYLAAARGDGRTCAESRERARLMSGRMLTSTRHLDTCVAGLLHLSLGEYTRAADTLAAAGRLEQTMGSVISGYTTRFPDQYAAYWQLGRTDEMSGELDEYADAATRLMHPTMEATAARCRALTATGDEIDDAFQSAIDLHARSPNVFEQARTRLYWGQRLRRVRRKADARTPLGEARKVFEALGATAWHATAQSELAACGERSAGQTLGATGPLTALTPREFEVAREVASGASNPEAAERLFISRRTVGYHLSNVFHKLGIEERRQLRNYFDR